MSISNNYAPVKQLGNGVTTQFSGNWKVLNASYIRVYLENVVTGIQTLQVLGANFTLVFNDNGFTVTMNVAPTNANYVVIGRAVDLTQTDPYRTSKGFQGKTIEDSFDKLTAIEQDQNDQIGRSLKFKLGSPVSNFTIDDPINGRSLKWDTVNNRITNSTSDIDTVAAQVAADAATAVAASNSATAQAGTATTQANAAIAAAAAAQAAVGGVKITVNDTTAAPLNTKLLVTTGLTKVTNNPAANETLTLGIDFTQVAPASILSAFQNAIILDGDIGNNAGDTANDLDISAFTCVSDDATPVVMKGAALTKRADANFVAGNNNGMLDTGAIGNGTYHLWEISNAAGTVVDYLLSLSATAPTMPATYTKKKRIWSTVRVGGSFLQFTKRRRECILKTPVMDVNAVVGTAAVTVTLGSVPTGIITKAKLNAQISSNGGSLYISALASTDVAPANNAAPLASANNIANATSLQPSPCEVLTNTSAQFRYRANAAGLTSYIITLGWIDYGD